MLVTPRALVEEIPTYTQSHSRTSTSLRNQPTVQPTLPTLQPQEIVLVVEGLVVARVTLHQTQPLARSLALSR